MEFSVLGTFVLWNIHPQELLSLETFVSGNFHFLELSFSTLKLAWNFRSLTLIIRPILYTIFGALTAETALYLRLLTYCRRL